MSVRIAILAAAFSLITAVASADELSVSILAIEPTESDFGFQVNVSGMTSASDTEERNYWFFAEERSGWIFPQVVGKIGTSTGSGALAFEWWISKVGGYPLTLYLAELDRENWEKVNVAMASGLSKIHKSEIQITRVSNPIFMSRDGSLTGSKE